MTGPHTDLLIVDDDDDLRQALSDLVAVSSGRRVLGVGSLEELEAIGPRALECGLVIVDVNLGAGKPGGLEVLAWLREHGYGGQIVFLTGHGRTAPELEQAHRVGGIPILSKPLAVDALMAIVESTR